MSAADEAIKNKVYGSGSTTLIISNEEMEDVMKIVKLLQESGLLIEGIDETITKETKKPRERFFLMLLGTLGVTMLGSAITARGVIRAGEGIIRAGENL